MNKKVIRDRVILLILVLFFIGTMGCTLNKTVTQDTKLLYMYRIYNSQYENYLSMANNPATTEEQKVIMRKKKPVLDTLGPLISVYDIDVQAGTSTAEQEQKIMDLLDSLTQ